MKSRLSQEQLDKILIYYNKGLSASEIEKLLEISHQTMWRISKQLNLTFKKGTKSSLTQEQLDKIKELAPIHTAAEIAEIVGVSYRIIQTGFKNLGLKPKGAKLDPLTEDQKIRIIE